MKFDFDTFEFTGLIAPGAVIVLALALLYPRNLSDYNPAFLVAAMVIIAYVAGHIVAAIGNICKPLFEKMQICDLASLSVKEWERRRYIVERQRDRLFRLIVCNLYRDIKSDDPYDPDTQTTIVNQMYLSVTSTGGARRVITFDGLVSLSRGLAVAFAICAATAAATHNFGVAGLCAIAAALAVYRMRKFRDRFGRELLQQFLLQTEPSAEGLPARLGS